MSEITEKIKVDVSFVKAIADMQRDLDAYHFAFVNIIGILRGKFGGSFVPAISQDMAASQRVNDEIHDIFVSAKIIREVYEKLIEGKGNPVLSVKNRDGGITRFEKDSTILHDVVKQAQERFQRYKQVCKLMEYCRPATGRGAR